MTVTLPSEDVDAALRRDAAIQWGWALFLAGGLAFVVTSSVLYWWVVHVNIEMISFLSYSFFCAPLCFVSCIGFIQLVSGTTCNRLPGIWRSLALWRRLVILSFVPVAILSVVPFSYFLFWISPMITQFDCNC
jgi:hypothetical protein